MILDRDKEPAKPYVHQDYPALRYRIDKKDPGKAEHVKVNNEDEDKAAADKGFTSDVPEAGTEYRSAVAVLMNPAPAPKAKKK